ncbi:MAG: 5-formyltetrahydrofolate cyclo-ligase [Clostridia bacterium]|nr:5-formyltetrahydrofolate cyclo-ligase [Clostridia bacterium]
MLNKKELRHRLIEKRNNIPQRLRQEKSLKITEKILEHSALKKASTVFIYVSFGSEVDTLPLIKELFYLGKRVGVPLCNSDNHTMTVYEIKDLSQLKKGHYGILEPDKSLKEIPKEDIDLIIVPGVAFDKEGYRMGYGGGYYDRFLADFDGYTIGISFLECMENELPKGEFDRKVNEIIKE